MAQCRGHAFAAAVTCDAVRADEDGFGCVCHAVAVSKATRQPQRDFSLIVEGDRPDAAIGAGCLIGIDLQRCPDRETESTCHRSDAEYLRVSRKYCGRCAANGEGSSAHADAGACQENRVAAERYLNALVEATHAGEFGWLVVAAEQSHTAGARARSVGCDGNSSCGVAGKDFPEVQFFGLDETQRGHDSNLGLDLLGGTLGNSG